MGLIIIGILIAVIIVGGMIFEIWANHVEDSKYKKSFEDENAAVKGAASCISIKGIDTHSCPQGLLRTDERIETDIQFSYKGNDGYVVLTDKRVLFKGLRYTGTSNEDDIDSHLAEVICELPVSRVASTSIQTMYRKYHEAERNMWGNLKPMEAGGCSMCLLVINGGGEYKMFMGGNINATESFSKISTRRLWMTAMGALHIINCKYSLLIGESNKMSFVEGLTLKYKPVMEQCFMEPFVQEMGMGTLSEDKLRNYIVQDSIYLRYYVKSYAYALAKSQTLKGMKRFYVMLGYVNDSENLTRLDFLRRFGLTDDDVDRTPKKIQCHQYCEFLEENAKKGDVADIIVAGLPCMLGYRYVFTELRKKYPDVMGGIYASLVNDYTSESYNEFCNSWIAFANEICEPLDEDRKKALEETFKQGTFHELYFWQMAGSDEVQGRCLMRNSKP